MSNAKLFLGQRLRRLRRDREMTQTDMAASLGVSPSYLNHLERNQRPVTAALLLNAIDGYTQAEIASMLAVPEGTVFMDTTALDAQAGMVEVRKA